MKVLALLLFPAALFASDVTGTFPAGERYEPPADHAPATTSRMYVRTVTRDVRTLELPASGDGSMLVWTIPANGTSLGARLTTPTGAVLRPGDFGSVERGLRRFRFDGSEVGIELPRGTHEVLHVMQTVGAAYRLDVDRPGLVVVAEPESAIALETWVTPLSRQPGQPVTLHARLRGIANAHVTARVLDTSVELSHRGDGLYEATLGDLTATGAVQVRFDATGETADGVRFARTGSGEFVAERGTARLHGVHASIEGGVLRVTASADAAAAGNYRFDVIVAGAKDVSGSRRAIAWGEGVRRLEQGANALAIEIPVDVTGDLHLDVRLLGLDAIGVAGRVVLDVTD